MNLHRQCFDGKDFVVAEDRRSGPVRGCGLPLPVPAGRKGAASSEPDGGGGEDAGCGGAVRLRQEHPGRPPREVLPAHWRQSREFHDLSYQSAADPL